MLIWKDWMDGLLDKDRPETLVHPCDCQETEEERRRDWDIINNTMHVAIVLCLVMVIASQLYRYFHP